MHQLTQNYRTGELQTVDIPMPTVKPGALLVRTAASVVSVGTEKAMIDVAKKSLLGKALARPDWVKQVLDKVRTEGIGADAVSGVSQAGPAAAARILQRRRCAGGGPGQSVGARGRLPRLRWRAEGEFVVIDGLSENPLARRAGHDRRRPSSCQFAGLGYTIHIGSRHSLRRCGRWRLM